MPADAFYPPMTYATLWLVLGLVILAAVVGWGFVVWWQTRPAAHPPPPPEPPPGWRLGRLKAGYLSRIDDIERHAGALEMSTRRAHQELSVTVRQFVEEASGLRAPTMTLTELGRSGVPSLGPVADAILRLYPVEFGPDGAASVGAAADVARGVVARWT